MFNASAIKNEIAAACGGYYDWSYDTNASVSETAQKALASRELSTEKSLTTDVQKKDVDNLSFERLVSEGQSRLERFVKNQSKSTWDDVEAYLSSVCQDNRKIINNYLKSKSAKNPAKLRSLLITLHTTQVFLENKKNGLNQFDASHLKASIQMLRKAYSAPKALPKSLAEAKVSVANLYMDDVTEYLDTKTYDKKFELFTKQLCSAKDPQFDAFLNVNIQNLARLEDMVKALSVIYVGHFELNHKRSGLLYDVKKLLGSCLVLFGLKRFQVQQRLDLKHLFRKIEKLVIAHNQASMKVSAPPVPGFVQKMTDRAVHVVDDLAKRSSNVLSDYSTQVHQKEANELENAWEYYKSGFNWAKDALASAWKGR